VGLLVQGAWAARLSHPSYMDAYYYATNGQRLAEGSGFTEMVIWQFLDEPGEFPVPSHTYWMPLPSILAAVGYRVSRQTFRGAQAPFWILAGLLPILSYEISLRFSERRWQARTAALLTATGGFYATYFGQPTTFAPFAWAGGLCLLALAAAGEKSVSPILWFLGGVAAGLSHLTRADGLLFLAIGLFTWLAVLGACRKATGEGWLAVARQRTPGLLVFVAGYLVVMGGWFLRNEIALGRLLPTVGTQTIFLTTYDDIFAFGRTFDLTHLVQWGWGNILLSRLRGVWIAAQTFIAVSCFIFLTPFVLWSWLKWRKDPEKWAWLRPMTWYTLALYGTMSLLFTFPGGRGGLFHSTAALWPWFMALAAGGINLAVDWVAARLAHWRPERAKRIFAALFIGAAVVSTLAIGGLRSADDVEARVYAEMGSRLPADAVVMVGNAPGFYYHTGLPSVSVPNEPVDVVLKAAKRYGVTHLLLDEDRPTPLDALYRGELQHPGLQWTDELEGRKLYTFREN